MDRTLSERLAQARREKGVREWRDVRRSEIAEAAKVDPSMVTLYEQGKSDPSEDVLLRLANFFDTTPAWLRYGVADMGSPLARLAKEPERPASELLQKAPAKKPGRGRAS